ncbi:MAG TPA: apolipoprotein N-acyltransferase [Pyrinomonadaceae bacterium]|nr:apolipoprotein N-acyltransferase [Pyrinomonadaceae bacterium]
MQEAVILKPRLPRARQLIVRARDHARAHSPSLAEYALAVLSSVLLVFSFPDFDLWPLAWVGLVPLLLAVARRPAPARPFAAFVLGWLSGTIFFYASCYWLTYSMIRYGGLPAPLAYTLLAPAAAVVGLFPAFVMTAFAFLLNRQGKLIALLGFPFLWTTGELARLYVTGQLWNAVGYSQGYVPPLIQAARWGGVYGVGFLIVAANVAFAYFILEKTRRAFFFSAALLCVVAMILALSFYSARRDRDDAAPEALVVGVQANVPMSFARTPEAMDELLQRHFRLSERGLQGVRDEKLRALPRLVVWSESPMNFAYSGDASIRSVLGEFARRNRAALIINSMEPAPNDGAYNSALMIDDEGRLIAQYDKIRLLPFGEYVPGSKWLPGTSLVAAIVGDFTPGEKYPLLSIGPARAGVFICFESAFPEIARRFAAEGADVLLNISNDGYLGPTPVRRQHLANAVFRAVEAGRPVLRVTNTGITARIAADGRVSDETGSFRPEVRTWTVGRAASPKTFYTERGDLFAFACALLSGLLLFIPKHWGSIKHDRNRQHAGTPDGV